MKTPIRIILIDDDAIFRLGTETLINKEDDIKLVGQADSGEYAPRLIDNEKPDVALVDLHLGANRLEGPSLIYQLKRHKPNLPCISLTIEDNPFLLLQLLDVGTDAIIRKNGIDLIKDTIRCVHNGGHIIQQDISYNIFQAQRERQILQSLSDNEREIFRRVGLGEDDRKIASDCNISKSTIKSRLVTMKKKLHLKTKAELVKLYHRFYPWPEPLQNMQTQSNSNQQTQDY